MTKLALNLLEPKSKYLTGGALQRKEVPVVQNLGGSCWVKSLKGAQIQIDEKEVETLEKAARLADNYTLTHKVSFVNKANHRKSFCPPSGPKPSPSLQSGDSNQNTPKPKPPGETKVKIPYLSLFAIIAIDQGILFLIVLF